MDPWSEQDLEYDRLAAAADAKRFGKSVGKKLPTRLALPQKRRLPHRDDMARSVASLRELAEYVGEIRAALEIPQARLAARAGVSRQWLVALEQGRPTVEAGKVFRLLEALGFEVTLTPYVPAPPWMLREVAAAKERREAAATVARRKRAGRRERAKLSRLVENGMGGGRLDLG